MAARPIKETVVRLFGIVVGITGGIGIWWLLHLDWWLGATLALTLAWLLSTWLLWQFEKEPVTLPLKDATRWRWLFEGASWCCLTAALITPLVCWLLIPSHRIADRQETLALADRVGRLLYVEGAIAVVSLFSLGGVRRWRPIGILIRCALTIGSVWLGSYGILLCMFALSFWR